MAVPPRYASGFGMMGARTAARKPAGCSGGLALRALTEVFVDDLTGGVFAMPTTVRHRQATLHFS
jgi:hypothetical protein